MANQAVESEMALSIGAETQIFVDDAIVSAKRGVVRTLHPGKKLEQPVLVPDRGWEGKRVYIYGTVHYDAHAQQFRMWYLTRLGRGEQHRAPGLRERQGDMILYATSADGIHWEKPDLGLHEFDGSRDNNILIFDKHSPTVIVDEAADPSERYKMAGWDWSRAQFGYWVAHSADGLVWNDYDVNPVLMNSDETLEAITVAHDHHRGEYLAFHRRWGDVGGHMRRLIAVSTSRNFLDWSDPELIIVSDEQDDAWIQDPEQRGEFYGMSGFVYGRQYLGFLPVFNVVRDVRGQEVGAEQSPWDGPIEAQLAHSRDGRTWERFVDRTPIIPRGAPGSFDAGCILCSADRPVVHGDEVWHYYTAINTLHGGPMPPKTATIARAAWRLDGFVSLDAGPFRRDRRNRSAQPAGRPTRGQCRCLAGQPGDRASFGRRRNNSRFLTPGLHGTSFCQRAPCRSLAKSRTAANRPAPAAAPSPGYGAALQFPHQRGGGIIGAGEAARGYRHRERMIRQMGPFVADGRPEHVHKDKRTLIP